MPNTFRRRLVAPWLALALVLSLGSLRAEVGVVIDMMDGRPLGLYQIGIVDDPDPFVWDKFSPGYSNRIALNEIGRSRGDGKPSLLFHPQTGTPMAVWAMNTPGGFDVVLSRYAAGAWSSPGVLAGSLADERDPVLAVDPSSGTVHLVYWIDDGSPRVLHQQAAADLTSWTTPVVISGSAIASRPSAAFHGGKLRVAYESHVNGFGATPREIVLCALDAQGSMTEVVAITHHPAANWPQVHGAHNDRLWVDWIDSEGEMTWRRRVATLPWEPVAGEPYQTTEQRDYHIRGAIKLQALW